MKKAASIVGHATPEGAKALLEAALEAELALVARKQRRSDRRASPPSWKDQPKGLVL
jgi:hypothetical protein